MAVEFLQNIALIRYPRTPHLQGSRYQPGDKGRPCSYKNVQGRFIVIEEKLDCANSGIGFNESGDLLLQSKGHYLNIAKMGGRERQFNLFKQWSKAHENKFLDVLEDRYVMFGEWMFAKHSCFYDALPNYWCEFDIYDRSVEAFLDSSKRLELLDPLPVVSVPILYAGIAPKALPDLLALLGPSVARTGRWRQSFEAEVKRQKLDLDLAWLQTDHSEYAEGLYIKVEEDGKTVERYKFVRTDFIQAIVDSDSHHSTRPIIPNGLRPGVDIFATTTDKTWPCANSGRL